MKVGVIGGGQLARMMVPPAIALGLEIRVLAEAEHSSAAIAATAVGDYRDLDTVLAFAEDVDVITFDHEHVPEPVLRALIERGVPVHPGPDALRYAQDKLLMRARLTELGLPAPAWAAVHDTAELADFLAANGGRGVLKTPRGGYDGKGVRVISSAAEAEDWFAALAEDGRGGALLVEELVEFRRELAALVARRPSGASVAWPTVETIQRGGVCAEVLAPAPDLSDEADAEARRIAARVADGLGVTGVLAVELFEHVDGRILVNELAMRPHNSGHWSIDGAVTSQFEQHLRAVLDLPLGDSSPIAPWSVMANVLGGPAGEAFTDRYAEAMAAHPDVKLHGYDKTSRPGRKVGHVTAIGASLDDVRSRARAAADLFG
ncbi:5-(carboxyamino)imidazole ribonucleotide synthase [Arenivirga flava]|uniref:N5-carboxyaminoimidazole ribonucleotide synthase n=1 Tax=Arenivirga flava TaxID=1930060 RepID=A0AA37UF61_9MICO|nr:5-(carboxyamino)imidazole ribonucleotide synthase [Arenivirga flava]GMA28028.1 N5-carboxyaminoimidazole ribonucleotide synthase [Arenivirga flava]